jgi:hypothetical protein
MRIRRITISIALAASLVSLTLSTAKAQYYYPPCSPFPLFWPFCAAGAIVGTAANVATAPFWLSAGAPPPFSPTPRYYGPPPYYPPPPYYGPR